MLCCKFEPVKGSNLAKTKLQNPGSNPPKAQLSTTEILRILHKWGIHTLGELAALDKEELAATATRFRKRVNATRTLTRGVRI